MDIWWSYKMIKSGDGDAAAIFDCSEYEDVIDGGHDSINASRMDNIIVDDEIFHSSDDEAVIEDGHDSISASRMGNEYDDSNDDYVWNLQQQQATSIQVPWIELYHRLVAQYDMI